MIDMKGKVAVVFGLANKRSIAYSHRQKLARSRRHPRPRLPERAPQVAKPKSSSIALFRPVHRPAPPPSSAMSRSTLEIDAVFAEIKDKPFPASSTPSSTPSPSPPPTPSTTTSCSPSPRRLPHRPRRQRLLAHRPRPRRRAADDRRRLHHSPSPTTALPSCLPQLQRHGRRQGRARSHRPLPRRLAWAQDTSASTPSPPAPSRRSPPAASATFRLSSILTAVEARSPLKRNVDQPSKWARPPSSFRKSDLASAASPAKSPSSTAVTTSPGCSTFAPASVAVILSAANNLLLSFR